MLSLRHRSLFCCILVGSLRLSFALGASQQLGDLGSEGRLLEQAVAAEDADKLDEAAALYQKFIDAHSGVPATYYYLGNLCFDTGRRAEGMEAFKRGKSASPG